MINMQLPATLGSRFIALFIDFCVIAAYALCLAAVTFAFYEYVLGGIPDIWGTVGAAGAHLIGFVTLTLPVGLYLFLTETSRHHATLGKRIANITVVSMRKKSRIQKANSNPNGYQITPVGICTYIHLPDILLFK